MMFAKSDGTAKTIIHKARRTGLPLRTALIAGGLACLAQATSAQDWIPKRCCPSTDCQQAASAAVTEVRGGYVIEGVEGVVSHDDPRVQYSKDGRFHACTRSAARPGMSQTLALVAGRRKELKCLFVPLIG